MKRMMCLILAWSSTMLSNPLSALGDEDPVLAGVWGIEQLEENGRVTPANRLEGSKLVFNANKFSFRFGPLTTLHGTYDVKMVEGGKSIVFLPTGGALKGKSLAGIYQVEGKTLRLCYAEPNQAPPREFSASTGSKATYMVLKKKEAN